jgi:ketosteroid isomerase-like protein
MTSTEEQIRDLGRRWVEAELRADTAALDAMAVPDFTLVGPLGFVLTKEQWLDRYRSGAFHTSALTWDDVVVRDYGGTAVAIGRQTQEAAYQGRASDGRFRVTQIVVRAGDDAPGANPWRLAGLHLSPIATPPGPPTSRAAAAPSS